MSVGVSSFGEAGSSLGEVEGVADPSDVVADGTRDYVGVSRCSVLEVIVGPKAEEQAAQGATLASPFAGRDADKGAVGALHRQGRVVVGIAKGGHFE